MELQPVSTLVSDAETGETQLVPVSQGKRRAFMAEVVSRLKALNDYEFPDKPVDQYIEDRSGKYVLLIEDIVDACVATGDLMLASQLLLNLVKMTKAGAARVQADIKTSKLRDAIPTKQLTPEQLKEITGRDV